MLSTSNFNIHTELLNPSKTNFPLEEERLFGKLPWITKFKTNESLKTIDIEKFLQLQRERKNNLLNEVLYSSNTSNSGLRLVGFYDTTFHKSYWGVWFGQTLQGPRRRVHGGAIGTAIENCLNFHVILQQRTVHSRLLTLIINYKKGVRICTPYLLEIHHVKDENQKIFLNVVLREPKELEEQNEIFVTATATFSIPSLVSTQPNKL